MLSLGSVNDTLGIINGVAQILKTSKLDRAIGHLGRGLALKKHLDDTGTSLTSISSQTTILSRVFIEESVVGEPLLPNLMKSFHEWYAAQILAALNLTQMVTDTSSVQDYMTILQTGQNARQRSVMGNVLMHAGEYAASRHNAQESFLTNYLGAGNFESCSALEAFNANKDEKRGNWKGKLDDLWEKDRDRYASEKGARDAVDAGIAYEIGISKEDADRARKEEQYERDRTNAKYSGLKSINVSDNKIGPIGELFEVTLSNPNNSSVSIKVPLYVQMQPSLIPVDIAPRFIDMNVNPTLWHRWTAWKAGEISFFKDFLLHRDLIKRRRSVVKDPEAAKAFSEFLSTVSKKDSYALGDVTDKMSATKSANLANSVIIFTEETVQRAAAESAVDLNNDATRKEYFRNSYAMIIAVVDTIHQRVKVWFNGIDGGLNFSYNDFKPGDKNFEPNDFLQALQAFSTNQIGRLR